MTNCRTFYHHTQCMATLPFLICTTQFLVCQRDPQLNIGRFLQDSRLHVLYGWSIQEVAQVLLVDHTVHLQQALTSRQI